MIESSLRRLLREVPPDARVLDVGGWAKPLTRADWVVDHMPYQTRGLFGRDGELPERFTAATWVARDICDRAPLPFADDSFDFAVCSHTLEDIRDPIWVCQELSRVARAGYIEVPSRLEEQTYGIQGPWVGWGHHRWLVDLDGEGLRFVFKHHVLQGRPTAHFPARFAAGLSPDDRVLTHWWEGRVQAREQVMMSAEELDPYLDDFVAASLAQRSQNR
ncbi:MAG: class I SAM-dependent methyltransferase [Candidatus Dormibacteria bacterium]